MLGVSGSWCWIRVMPPLAMAAEMLASPVAKTKMPQASERPTFGLVMADPADTGPFMLSVTGATTGPCAMAHPPSNTTQHKATIRVFIMVLHPYCSPSFVPLAVHAAQQPNASDGG